jgi:hypothetical protein
MKIDLAVEMMREFGRVAKRRGYIKCDSDLFAGLGAYKAFNGKALGDEALNAAYIVAKNYVAEEVMKDMKEGA